MLTFDPSQFDKFLSGETKPALFVVDGTSWVFRYPSGAGQQLGLASEYMGYQVASWLAVSVPVLCLARTSEAFRPDQSGVRIPAGLGTATRWIDDAQYPNLEHHPLAPFWEEDKYLRITAAARVADTWMMNYDRRKRGNVAVRGTGADTEVFFLDFDQAFLAKESPRPHWIEAAFTYKMLNDRELLSGFSGTGKVKSETAQRCEHFDCSVNRLLSVSDEDVEQALRGIPDQWGIGQDDRRVWKERLLARRRIVLEILKASNLTNDICDLG
jgi:hypothetical protein